MNDVLLLVFTIGGGIPPESSEMLQIYRDGKVVCVAANAWPEGEPQNEAGLYGMKLSPSGVEALKSYISKHRLFALKEEYEPAQMDCGFNILHLYNGEKEKEIRWNPYAALPKHLKELRKKLREILQDARQYPIQAVNVSLQVNVNKVEVDRMFKVELRVKNCGKEPTRILVSKNHEIPGSLFSFYPAPAEEVNMDFVPAVEFYSKSQPISAEELSDPRISGGAAALSPGEEIEICKMVPSSLLSTGTYRLYGFVNSQIEIMFEGQPQMIDCFMVTQQATLVVER